MKKYSDPRLLTFEMAPKKKNSRFWSQKVSLGQFEPKAFGKGLIKPLVENPTSNFHKQDLENYEMNPIKS